MKLLLASLARTGSNYYFHEVLKKANTYECVLSEPFKYETMTTASLDYAYGILEKVTSSNSALVKTHLNQLENLSADCKTKFLNNNWQVILLLRKDIFRCALSHALADSIKQFSEYTYNEQFKYTIDTNVFTNLLERKLKQWESFVEFKKSANVVSVVYYEDLSFIPSRDIALTPVTATYPLLATVNIKRKSPDNTKVITNFHYLKELSEKVLANYTYNGIKNNNGLIELND